MTFRRALAVALPLLCGLVGFWALKTTLAAEAMASFMAPRYADVTAEQMAASDVSREQLATVAVSSMQKYKDMEGRWLGALQTSHRAVATLIVVSMLFAVCLSVMLWRVPRGSGA
jgi:hypothetical protein